MATHRSTWKQAERRAAEFFGSRRTPLSGGNSAHTRSDTLSKHFFVETKFRANSAVWNLFRKTVELAKREKKLPCLALFEKGSRGFLLVMRPEDFEAAARKLLFTVRIKRHVADKTSPDV